MNQNVFQYRLLLRLLSPALLIFNAWQAVRAGELRLFRQRLGICLPRRTDSPLWLHAASVGELIAAQPLITRLKKQFPELPIVITTITPTGAQLAQQRLPADVQHFYLPVDWPGATARFLRTVKPRAALIMETELWPNLFLNINRQNIPLIIINGRLSNRSRNASRWVKMLYATALNNISAVLARSEDDAKAYIQLGAPTKKVRTLGNIKLANANNTSVDAIDLGRPFVLAASTHDNEEQKIAQLWQQMETQGRLLVIAPRHPKRREDILKNLPTQQVAVRSRNETIETDTQIYLADTLGELANFIAGADIVFMGGSLVPHGGQNILEPARLGKPIVFGPHMDNFSEEVNFLLKADGAKQVENTQALQETFASWLAHPEQATIFGENAAQLMQKQNAVLEHYLQAVVEICELQTQQA